MSDKKGKRRESSSLQTDDSGCSESAPAIIVTPAGESSTSNTVNLAANPRDPETPANRVMPAIPATNIASASRSATLSPAWQGRRRSQSISGLHPRLPVDSILTDEETKQTMNIEPTRSGRGLRRGITLQTYNLLQATGVAQQNAAQPNAAQQGQIVTQFGLLSPFVHQALPPPRQGSPEAEPDWVRLPMVHQLKALQAGKVFNKPKINPFTTQSFINQTDTRLISLPDLPLIAVLTFLPPQDLAKLRHVSREFLRLFDDCEEFKKYHDTSRSTVWATPDPSLYFAGQSVDTLFPLCNHCGEVRKEDPLGRDLVPFMPYLHCSQCKNKHRSMHFSQGQRKVEDDEERVCIGHEGAICIDKMLFISWRQAVSAAQNPSLSRIQCQTSIGPANYHCFRLKCRFKSIMEVQFKSLNGDGIQMRVSKVLHFPFKREESGKVNASEFLATVETISGKNRKIESPLDHLCLSPTTVLRAFDPNVCDCLDWEDKEWKFNSWTLRPFEFKRAPKPLGDGRPHQRGGYVGSQGRCMGRQHGFSSKLPMGDYEVDIFQCPDSPSLLVFQVVYTCTFKTASDLGWRCNLHAFTYHLEQDPEMRGLTWCNESGCGVGQLANRHQSLLELEKKYNL